MKSVLIGLVIVASWAVSACNSSKAENELAGSQHGADPNLQCSALISAANALVIAGKAENDPDLAKRALVSSMTYLNAYAIPKGLKEAEAFRQVKAQRAVLLEARPVAEIISGAKRCVNRTASLR